MTRDEELRLIEEAVAAGRITRLPYMVVLPIDPTRYKAPNFAKARHSAHTSKRASKGHSETRFHAAFATPPTAE